MLHSLVFRLSFSVAAIVGAYAAMPAYGVDLLTEDFEGVTLNPVVTFESEIRERQAWATVGPDGPAGWTEVNLTSSVNDAESGVMEFEGWRFVDKQWWIETAGDQGRTNFISGVGTIAVADPDEWDDFGNPDLGSEDTLEPGTGVFDSTLRTPAISIAGASEPVRLNFSSSWFDEDMQTATLTATYNTGPPEELDHWTSVPTDPNFKNEAFDDSLTYTLQSIPAGATDVTFEFRLQGNNDWWWAIDNVRVYTGDSVGAEGVLKTIIDRDTGEVSIVNNTGGDVLLRGYSIRSAEGAFDEQGASYLSDSDSNWVKATQDGGEINDLSELHLDNATLAVGGTIDLGTDVWLKYFEENKDVTFTYLVEGSDDQIVGLVEFINGPLDQRYEFLDLNFDGTVDINDWTEFLAITDTADLSDLPTAQAYLKGDLNDDGRLSAADAATFRQEFDTLLGAGSFVAMLHASPVPEPSSLSLALLGFVGLVRRRRVSVSGGSREQKTSDSDRGVGKVRGQIKCLFVCSAMLVALATTASAQRLSDGVGVTEWEEWAFADKDWWADVAGNQRRAEFTNASGVVAIADPDEWDDIGGPGGSYTFNSQLRSPAIDLTGVDPNSINLTFASSWRDEDTQGASLQVFYDGVATEVFRWSSDQADPNFKDDAPNELLSINLPDAGSATTMQLGYNLFNATNDWWWAIDNVNVSANTGTLLFENFESVVLGDPIDEVSEETEVYSQEGPDGWVINTDNYIPPVTPINERHVETITRFVPPPPPATLELRIDTVTGNASLVSVASEPVVLTSYSIASPAGALTDTDWSASNLEARDVDAIGPGPGDSWQTVIASPELVFEAFLNGETVINPGESLFIGQLYDSLIGDEELEVAFSYLATDAFGQTLEATSETTYAPVNVQFVSLALPGDFNADGFVNAADYTVWQDNLGSSFDLNGNGDETAGSAGVVDAADYALWKANFGSSVGTAGSLVDRATPEPSTIVLSVFALVGLVIGRVRFARIGFCPAAAAIAVLLAADAAQAQLPPQPFVDRDYRFGEDDSGAVVGQRISQTDPLGNRFTFDGAGEPMMNQIIILVSKAREISGQEFHATYSDTTDRPDGGGGIGLALNQAPFERQYLRTGFGEALNYPEQSPSSVASLINPGGTLNYFRINDRGFELWVKPTNVAKGEQHIVMDSQQHGVLINSEGNFAMRYASEFDVDIEQLPGDDGELGTEDDILEIGEPEITPADYATDVAAVNDQWYHLSVVRPRGPDNGSILYVNGIAEAVGFGTYDVETIVNIGEGNLFTNIARLDTSPLYIGARTDAEELDRNLNSSTPQDDFYFSGVVDDLEMFVMGLNDNDNLSGGGDNVLNDWGEYIFQRDNDYAAAFAPAVDGDLNNDNMVTIADAALFASNWLFEKELTAIDPFDESTTSRLVGDLSTRALGDFDYNGVVNLEDWAIVNNANPTVGAAALRFISHGVVPEPASGMLFGMALLGLLHARKR